MELNERWNDWDYEYENNYYFKSIHGIFEKDYNLVEKINNRLERLYFELDKMLNEDEKSYDYFSMNILNFYQKLGV